MKNIVEIEDLRIEFHLRDGVVNAVNGVTLAVKPGEVLGVVGESGSGKSLSARAIMNLLPRTAKVTSGRVRVQRKDGSVLDVLEQGRESRAMREVRGGQVGMVFQEPMTALSPMHSIGRQITTTLSLHTDLSRTAQRDRARELLDLVLLPDPRTMLDKYPHQLSGGMRQRAMIAMALSCNPALLLADEPTTALDVTTEAQILELIRGLQEKFRMGVIFITHNFGVVAELADRVAVMRTGEVVEEAGLEEVFYAPRHAYTQRLLSLIPRLPKAGAAPSKPEPPLSQEPVIDLRGLTMDFTVSKDWLGRSRDKLRAVDDVSFQIDRGETFGLLGESGSGKSTVARCILGAYAPTAGSIHFRDRDNRKHVLTELRGERLRRLRQHFQMVFQDPYSSLNPRMPVEQLLGEPLVNQGETDAGLIRSRAAELLEQVGLSTAMLSRYPHAFSGGQRQRISIARALCTNPSFVVLDESVSALDVSIAAQIIDLLRDLQVRLKLTYLFITHDLSMIANFADRIGVMRHGRMVEVSETRRFFSEPRHPYSEALLHAVPIPDPRLARERRSAKLASFRHSSAA